MNRSNCDCCDYGRVSNVDRSVWFRRGRGNGSDISQISKRDHLGVLDMKIYDGLFDDMRVGNSLLKRFSREEVSVA
jgi:hypothetical protein